MLIISVWSIVPFLFPLLLVSCLIFRPVRRWVIYWLVFPKWVLLYSFSCVFKVSMQSQNPVGISTSSIIIWQNTKSDLDLAWITEHRPPYLSGGDNNSWWNRTTIREQKPSAVPYSFSDVSALFSPFCSTVSSTDTHWDICMLTSISALEICTPIIVYGDCSQKSPGYVFSWLRARNIFRVRL